ncbi:hypothetical protein EPI10_002149 [Gossypium australe]|uniref:Uncharacterized protein n=1 Tax=Gossypium australe TaxID=47621 RepID=A0A5B6VDJ5_9ROSI|nr:hypothetical protein EPI10_002149 [Gossypium australe]
MILHDFFGFISLLTNLKLLMYSGDVRLWLKIKVNRHELIISSLYCTVHGKKGSWREEKKRKILEMKDVFCMRKGCKKISRLKLQIQQYFC